MSNNKPNSGGPSGSLLVGIGQSQRLREMREKHLGNQPRAPAPQPYTTSTDPEGGKLSPELLLARDLIDQRLMEILSGLPAGKQQSLFKIRFGVELNQIKELPIKCAVALLKITGPKLHQLSASMKRIGDLNYNGRRCD